MFGSQGYLPIEPNSVVGLQPLEASDQTRGLPSNTKQFGLLALQADLANDGSSRIRLVDPYELEPSLPVDSDRPDVVVRVQQLAFHPGAGLLQDEYQAVTMRVDVGEDPLAEDVLDPVFWSIAAGLDLHAALDGSDSSGQVKPQAFRSDFSKGLKRSRVLIPGGLGLLRFELEAHRPDPAWKKFWKFASGRSGQALASVIGFPMISQEALSIIDEAFNKFLDNSDTLMSSAPIRYALSQGGKEQFTAGLPIFVPSLNSGVYVLSSLADQKIIQATDKLAGGHGALLDADTSITDYLSSGRDPFKDLTYAIIRVETRPINIAEVS